MEVAHHYSPQPLNCETGDPIAPVYVADRDYTCEQSNGHITMAPSEGEF